MKNILIFILLIMGSVIAKAQTDLRQFIQMDISGECKHIINGDIKGISYGPDITLEWVNNHLLLGAGFDNGVRDKGMEQYNTFFYVKAGYVLYFNKIHVTPFTKAGWFMDVYMPQRNTLTAAHQFMTTIGGELTWLATEYIWLNTSIQVYMTNLKTKGTIITLGVKMPLYDFKEKKSNQ